MNLQRIKIFDTLQIHKPLFFTVYIVVNFSSDPLRVSQIVTWFVVFHAKLSQVLKITIASLVIFVRKLSDSNDLTDHSACLLQNLRTLCGSSDDFV
jgi:hypothetical protein